jgi:hypothetical protein
MRGMGILEAQVYGYMDCPWIVMETNKTEHIYLNGFSGDVFLNFDSGIFGGFGTPLINCGLNSP